MFKKIFRPSFVVGIVCCCVCAPASARDLIQTLYHADFTPDTDDEIPRFTLDGELGILVNTGNTSAASVKAAVNSDHETENWSSVYFAELLYKESGTPTTERDVSAQRFFTSAQFDYKLLTPGRRLFMYGDYEDDQFTGYDHRASLAAGWSQFVSTEAGEENTKSRSETSLSANVFGSLAMKLSFILNHETDTAEDVAALSTETSVALVYQFF
jgi:putative salt-induced outer membrane protein YdiY